MAALRRPIILIPLVLLALFLLFVALGFGVAPRLVRSAAQDYVAKNLPETMLSLGAIKVNPLDLSVEIRDIAIASKADPKVPMAAAKRLYVNASIASLWHMSPQLDAVDIEAPLVDAVLRKDGSLNLAELVPPDTGEPTPEVSIKALAVTRGSASFTDDRRADPQVKTLEPISFALADFETTSTDGGGFKLDAASKDGETFHWDGTLAMAPLASAGNFRVGSLKLTSLYRFVSDMLPVVVSAGTLDISGRYAFTAPAAKDGTAPPLQFDADIASFALDGLAARTAAGDVVELATLRAAPTRVSLGQDSAALGEVAITGLKAVQAGGAQVAIDRATLAASRYSLKKQAGEAGLVTLEGVSGGIGPSRLSLGRALVQPSRFDAANQRAEIGALALTDATARGSGQGARLVSRRRLRL